MNPSDLAEIHHLYAAYCYHCDRGDGERFSECFTDDAHLATGSGDRSGREAIAAFGTQVPKILPGIRHFTSNVYVEGDGDEATGGCYLIVMSTSEGPKMALTGKYADKLRRVDGRWRFSERVMTPDYRPGPDEARAAGVVASALAT